MASINISDLVEPLIFRSRPEPIPGDLRPLWRIGIILLILDLTSRGGKSTLGRLHVLSWAVRTRETRENLLRVIREEVSPHTLIVRIEPSLNRAIDLALGEGLVKYVSGDRIQITPMGKKAVNLLLEQENLLASERMFLKNIGKSTLTESIVNLMFSEGQ